MIASLRRLIARLSGTASLPEDFAGRLADDEEVLASAHTAAGPLVATHLGLWLPEGQRVGWHLVSKASWDSGVLRVIVAEEAGTAGGAVLLRDLPEQRFQLADPGRLPQIVHTRVTSSIRSRHHRELPGGGAWFVQRKVPGRDGILLQVRPDQGTDPKVVARFAERVAEQLGPPGTTQN